MIKKLKIDFAHHYLCNDIFVLTYRYNNLQPTL
jgi:hypothetical protein